MTVFVCFCQNMRYASTILAHPPFHAMAIREPVDKIYNNTTSYIPFCMKGAGISTHLLVYKQSRYEQII